MKSVSKNFGGFKALTDVTMSVSPGELRAVIGSNGAGKSTLLNILSGVLRPSSGEVTYAGASVRSSAPDKLVLKGMSRSFQITSIFNEFSAFENVQLALMAFAGDTRNLLRSRAMLKAPAVSELLESVGIADMSGRIAGELAAGDRKRLEFAMTLASNPQLLLLDEPTAGMAPSEREVIIELLLKLNCDRGVTIVFTEHDLDMVYQLAQRVSVFHQGQLLTEGTPDQIRTNAKVREVYIGSYSDADL
ncbi:ABC transporter ATP-binding protein [Micromonospora sp. STR1s_5]|nr:ABC transporter ATP-binding protein [Micromonospora sp. STR1s_5]